MHTVRVIVRGVEWINMKMDEGAGNEHDYNDDHDLAHTAKNHEQ